MFTNHFGIHRVLDMLDMLGCRKEFSQGLCAMQMCHSPRASGRQLGGSQGVKSVQLCVADAENRT